MEFTKSAGKLIKWGQSPSDNGIVDDDDELMIAMMGRRSDFRRPTTATDRLLNVASCATFEGISSSVPKETPGAFGVVCESATAENQRCGKDTPGTARLQDGSGQLRTYVRAKPQRSLL